jgi:hypothetical protein
MQGQEHKPGDSNAKPDNTGLIVLSVLPVMIIAVVLLAVGGVGVGFLIPAITCGAMIGMLTFVSLREKPRG